MASFRCCDCGEIKATKSELEGHLNSDHIGWTPYQCFYCCQQGVSTRKPNKEMLREHVTQRHPDQEFTFLCTDEPSNEKRLKDMLNRSISLDVTPAGGPMAVEHTSPFVISLSASPQTAPKDEVILIEDSERNSHISMEPVAESDKQNTDDADVKQNFSIVGNCRCSTCDESVPRNLILIRDHVKLHFKEKTGCMPVDLTNLLPNLQNIYCQLLLMSFPSVGASILNDDIPEFNRAANQKEPDDDDDQLSFENERISVKDVMTSSSTSNHHICKECGKTFDRLVSLKSHLTMCKLNHVNKYPITNTHPPSTTHQTMMISCDVCNQKFSSVLSLSRHKSRKHGITVLRHCKQCKLDLGTTGFGGFRAHLLISHLNVPHLYQCSLCGSHKVTVSTINEHDREFHSGQGKAVVIYNIHRYKEQLEKLQKKLIVTVNSSSRPNKKLSSRWKAKKSKKLALHHILNLKRTNIAQVKSKKTVLSCEICNDKVASISGLKSHRAKKHGILVKWYCKQCNVEPGTVNTHLLTVHIGEKKTKKNSRFYKEQLKALQKQLIVDLNSSTSAKSLAASRKPKNQIIGMPAKGSNGSESGAKYAQVKSKKSVLSCEICNDKVTSISGLKSHRSQKHGILVKWYCKQCNVNLVSGNVNTHLLMVHIGEKKATNNYHFYKEQLETLQKQLIVDFNSGNKVTVNREPTIEKELELLNMPRPQRKPNSIITQEKNHDFNNEKDSEKLGNELDLPYISSNKPSLL